MKQPYIIAIAGSDRGVGKTTLRFYLHRRLFPHGGVRTYSFATPLYEIADILLKTAYGVETYHKSLFSKETPYFNGHSLRDYLIAFGAVARQFDEDIFVKHAEHEYILAARQGYSFMLIDDLRFPNEVSWVKSKPSKIIYLSKKNEPPSTLPAEGLLPLSSVDIFIERGDETPTELADWIYNILPKELLK